MRVLIIGCGYLGIPLGAALVKQGHVVFGLRRTEAARSTLVEAGIVPLLGDITQPGGLAALPADYDWVANCVSSGGGGAGDYRQVYLEGSRNLMAWLDNGPLEKFVHASSTSVYGQTDASVVDECSLAEPTAETARVLRETEQVLLLAKSRRGFPALILRLAGIYGPGRGARWRRFLKGEARMTEHQADRVLNMIHRQDAVGALLAALTFGKPGEIYNAVDDEPVTERDFFAWLAATTGQLGPRPRLIEASPPTHARGQTSKRVCNRKLKTELGFHFAYPTFRQGYGEFIARWRQGVEPRT